MAPSIDCNSSLYCAEDALGVVAWDDEIGSLCEEDHNALEDAHYLNSIQDQLWADDGELSAFAEKETLYIPQSGYLERLENNSLEGGARQNAVSWILKVNSHYGFGPLTALLSVNYLDRFLSRNPLQQDKPWMTQLAAVTCLSLAAKVEETEVPLLLDFQVEDAKYVFESRTIQRMELLVLSTLEWRMTSVTPFSYIDHASSRVGIPNRLFWAFVMRCNELLLSTLQDVRFLAFLPSVVAAAVMLHVIKEIDPINENQYENRLLGAMKMDKEILDGCIRLIAPEAPIDSFCGGLKRKCTGAIPIPASPDGVLDASFSCESGNNTPGSASDSDSNILSVSPAVLKKRRVEEFCSDHYSLKDL